MSELSSPSAVVQLCFGPMKSGKSRFLVQKAEQLLQAGQSFLAFKPVQDTRDGSCIRTRDAAYRDVQALPVRNAKEMLTWIRQAVKTPHELDLAKQANLFQLPCMPLTTCFRAESPLTACLIDEVFLLDDALFEVLDLLQSHGISVYMSGLDRDFRGEYFPLRATVGDQKASMKDVIDRCDGLLPLTADCEFCGEPASLTQRLINGEPAPYESPTVLIGDEEYQPRCVDHHYVPHASLVSLDAV